VANGGGRLSRERQQFHFDHFALTTRSRFQPIEIDARSGVGRGTQSVPGRNQNAQALG
jgi:hypothetical protein